MVELDEYTYEILNQIRSIFFQKIIKHKSSSNIHYNLETNPKHIFVRLIETYSQPYILVLPILFICHVYFQHSIFLLDKIPHIMETSR